jgi:Rod binding domain-containing protein
MTVQQVLLRTNGTNGPVAAGMLPATPPGSATAVAADGTTAKTAKLADAAQQFEAMMLTEMLKPLHFGSGVDEGGEEGPGGAADTLRGMATDALGKALAANGGMGIAKKIVEDVTKEGESREARRRGAKVQ